MTFFEKLTATSSAFDSTIQVKVGKDNKTKTFTLHKGVLASYSGYFVGAQRGGFAEAQTGIINLPEEEVAVF